MLDWIKAKGKNVQSPLKAGDLYQGEEVYLNPKIWGPNLKTHSLPVSFVFAQGGVGDYINWCSAINYIRHTYGHIDGRIFVSELFLEVAQYLFGDIPRWKVFHRDTFGQNYEGGSPLCYPKPGTQLINACGAHLMDVGMWYFACQDPLPDEFRYLMEIKYDGPWKWPELDPNSNFAIFTPGATSEVREMPVKAFNEIVAYTISKDITPVFLGKRDLSEAYEAKFSHYNLSVGVDLRERTTLIEATQLMRKARFILGLDNGLLHMAGTTDCPTIFGHNVATIPHRVLRRKQGITIDITVPESELPCIGCQSKMRFIKKHDFRKCFFKERDPSRDRRCLPMLFKNDSKEWKDAIDKILKMTKGRKRG
jgi:hypothetical protein